MTRYAMVFLLVFVSGAWADHHEKALTWYKGNIHTHSLWSDGNDFPEMICEWYRDQGYNFLALTDHNIMAVGDVWMSVKEIDRRSGGAAMPRYLARFDKEWWDENETEWVMRRSVLGESQVKLKTLAEFQPLVERPGQFILIHSEEITDRFGDLPVHMNATNLAETIRPQGGSSVQDVMRRNLAAVAEQAARLRRPILVHLNHPNFRWGVTAEQMAAVVEERFFEVYNGHPGVNHTGDDVHASVERLWDIANTIRLAHLGAAPLMGVATDDSHHYHGRTNGSTSGRGWVMVHAASLEAGAIVNAMSGGDFYASSGVTLRKVEYDDDAKTLSIMVQPLGDAKYTIDFIGTLREFDATSEPVRDEQGNELPVTRRYSDDVGRVLKTVEGTMATYELTGRELYVRAVVSSDKPPLNPSFDAQVRQAWTQPVGWRAAAGQ